MVVFFFFAFLFIVFIIDPQPCPEGSYELGSVYLSVLQFSWDWFTSFISKLCMLLRGHLEMCVTVLGFFWKIPHQVKMIKKWYRNRVFGFSRKIVLLVFSGNDVKYKCLWSFNISKNCMSDKNLVLKV